MSTEDDKKGNALEVYRKRLLEHRESEAKVKNCMFLLIIFFAHDFRNLTLRTVREGLKQLKKDYEKTEDDLKALQSVGQIIGEVLRQLDEEKCMLLICMRSACFNCVQSL
jgi:26S proteasome regulatory subunit T4